MPGQRTYRFTPAAARDLDRVRQWLTQPGAGPRAYRLLRRIDRAIRDLVDTPYRGMSGTELGTRELSCEGHPVIYRLSPDTGDSRASGDVVVLRVFGTGRGRVD